uniref:Cytochrome P450 monooxygenase CYP52X1 n=1 Tax=Ganoderma boninense TaxID=34458 RepID=A0A5K1K670_9APHY|nr:Cytochrome P450 monooxygenase CYP52X1 [Ganoderma boninense]
MTALRQLTDAGVSPSTKTALLDALRPLVLVPVPPASSPDAVPTNGDPRAAAGPLLAVSDLRAMRTGANMFVDLTAHVPSQLTVEEATAVERRIREALVEARRDVKEVRMLEQHELSELRMTSGSLQATPARSVASVNVEGSDAALQIALDGGVSVQELAPVDRGVRAWTFCFCSFVLETMIWGFCFSFNVFQNYYTAHPPFNSSSSISIAAVSHLILLQGVLFGISGGMLYVPIVRLIPEWFSERRGLAGGIIFAGGGFGGFVFPFLLNVMLESVGLRWTLRIWAIVSTVIIGIALLGIRPRLPLGLLTSPLFWSVSLTLLLQGLSYFPVSLYITSFTTALSTPFTAIVVTSILNSSAVGGQIILGHLSDRYLYPWVMFLSAIGSGTVAFLLWGLASSATQLYLFAVIFGALSGRGASMSIGGVFGKEGYGAVEIFVGSCAIATGAGSVLVAVMSRRARHAS